MLKMEGTLEDFWLNTSYYIEEGTGDLCGQNFLEIVEITMEKYTKLR